MGRGVHRSRSGRAIVGADCHHHTVIVESAVLVAAPAARVWEVVTDWPRHSGWVPLTRVQSLPGPDRGVGARFVGRTGVGPLAFDDPMEVVSWTEPVEQPDGSPPQGRCEVRKQGRVVRGRAWIEVVGTGRDRCRLVWGEDVRIGPRALDRVLSPLLSRPAAGQVLRVLRRAAEDATADAVARRQAREVRDGEVTP